MKTSFLLGLALLLATLPTNAQDGWFEQSSGTTNSLYDISFIDSDNGTIVGYQGTILRTTDGGTNWITQSSGTSEHLSGVCFTDSENGTVVGGPGGIILRTTDGGTTWITQSSGLPEGLNYISFTDSDNGTVVGQNGTILRTTDGGTNWLAQSSWRTTNLSGVSFTDSINGTAVGENGIILRTTDGGVTFIEDEISSSQPEDFLLSQNYPNPFNPKTKIIYEIPEISSVTLKIYDVLGNEIATLINEEKPAGVYEVEFNGTGLSNRDLFL
jgi:photosystem II stability/assembly factor-like uncharacterized protein